MHMSFSHADIFGELTDEDYQKLIYYARRITRSEEMAKDVVQEALRIGVEKSHQIRDPTRAFSWLLAIIRNEAYKQLHFSHREMFLPSMITGSPEQTVLVRISMSFSFIPATY